ncbi:hypothetical protein AFEL58S_00238 [Afipia felis]
MKPTRVATAITMAIVDAQLRRRNSPTPDAIYANPATKLRYRTNGTILSPDSATPRNLRMAFPPETIVAMPNRTAAIPTLLITALGILIDIKVSHSLWWRKSYRSSLNICLPALKPTYPLFVRANCTHLSGSNAPGFRHIPSGVGRHFGSKSIGPPVIFPTPFSKRTRLPMRPSSMVIFHGCPSATLAANDALEPETWASALVTCTITPASMTKCHVVRLNTWARAFGDNESDVAFKLTVAISLILKLL